MSHLNLVCLSLAPSLRCVGFTVGQFATLLIPPATEVIISSFFIYLYPSPGRWAQVLLAVDSVLYFVWSLLDVLSRVVPTARTSLSLFRALDHFVGAVSFTSILFYSIYLYRLSYYGFIPILPRKLQPFLEISLPILLVIAVAINEVSSFVGTYLSTTSDQPLVIIRFSNDDESLWLSLSQTSLTTYTLLQFLFFLLAFSRIYKVFLNRRRIELTHSDEQHYFNGVIWITVGIFIGVIETITGFARVSFGMVLARRLLRLVARTILMFGLLRGLDVTEDFENLTDELRGVSRFNRGISRFLGVNPERDMFRRITQADERATAEKRPGEGRVTVHYEQGRAPFLQIRFSTLDFPAQPILPDTVQGRRRSLSGSIPGYTDAGTSMHSHGAKDVSDEMAAAQNAMLETRRARSLLDIGNDRHVRLDWFRPPERIRERQESGGNISNRSIVRDLERRFPNLPPRVTGKYRGSILGENCEEDPFPVVGVSRQSSLLRDGVAQNSSEEGGTSVTLSASGSIRRKPAPPLLENITYISDRRKRPASTWGGLASNSPVTPDNPRRGSTPHSPDSALAAEPSTPRSRKMTARNAIKRVSRALSDTSIRSAEWLASASSSRSSPLTATEIEMYRRGTLGPGSTRLTSGTGGTSSAENLLTKARRSTDDAHSKPNQSRASVGI